MLESMYGDDFLPPEPPPGLKRRARGGSRPRAGRKRITIDLEQLEKLCAMQCTHAEIAGFFQVSERTIEKRSKEPETAEVMARGRSKGRISIRRAQMRLLEGGNATMAVWLGKQYLGQRDITPIELSGPNGNPLKLGLEAIDAIIKQAENKNSRRSD